MQPNGYSEIQEHEVLAALDSIGSRYQVKDRYIFTTCPLHEDRNPSVQIFRDDWFVNCMAGCGRFHITKAFPHLRDESLSSEFYERSRPAYQFKKKDAVHKPSAMNYKQFNLREQWEKLPKIPDHISLKGIPAEYMNEIGWRMEDGSLGMGSGILIPYFDNNLETIPFAQVRHPKSSPVRFHFLKDAQPRLYGTWNLEPGKPIMIVEGCSDWLVMDYSGIPAIAVPSSSQTSLLKKMAAYCQQQKIELVYGGDNDEAGDKLRQALDEGGFSYRVCQPPKEFNDWSDFFVAQGDLADGVDAICRICDPYLYPDLEPKMSDEIKLDIDLKMEDDERKNLQEVFSIFGEGTKLIYRE